MMISAVPREVLGIVWGDVGKLLYKSVDTSNGKYSIDDLYHSINNGQYVLWIVMDKDEPVAAITTSIISYPGRKAMAMDWIGGSRMKEWLPMAMKTLSEYSRKNGCTHLEGYGRKAWGRWLSKYGWKPEYIAYRMEL
tara:strand:- start:392 stop:802 length:411 start_codon:yes stop_codon:yes gene_type:complete